MTRSNANSRTVGLVHRLVLTNLVFSRGSAVLHQDQGMTHDDRGCRTELFQPIRSAPPAQPDEDPRFVRPSEEKKWKGPTRAEQLKEQLRSN